MEYMLNFDVDVLGFGYVVENDVVIMFCDIRGFIGFFECIML